MRKFAVRLAASTVMAAGAVLVAAQPAHAVPDYCLFAKPSKSQGAAYCYYGTGSFRARVTCESWNGNAWIVYGPWRPTNYTEPGTPSVGTCLGGWMIFVNADLAG